MGMIYDESAAAYSAALWGNKLKHSRIYYGLHVHLESNVFFYSRLSHETNPS